jgi:hypothetical protein
MQRIIEQYVADGQKPSEGIRLLRAYGCKVSRNLGTYENLEDINDLPLYYREYILEELGKVSPALAPKDQNPITTRRVIEVSEKREEVKSLYGQASATHAAMRHATTDGERYDHAKELVERIYPAIAATQNPPTPTATVEAPTTADGILNRILQLRAQVSKLKKKLNNPEATKEKQKEWKDKLYEAEIELAKLDKKD